jgi:serine/threonine protein kinase
LAHALRLLDQIGGALARAHRRGVIHRDVKPGNVLLDEEGYAYLSDFGIASRLTDEAEIPLTSVDGFRASRGAQGRATHLSVRRLQLRGSHLPAMTGVTLDCKLLVRHRDQEIAVLGTLVLLPEKS